MDIRETLQQRILILDGAMGTVIQQAGVDERDYGGGGCACHCSQKGNNERLNLTAPHIIRNIHEQYISAGADIITTNTFSANSISQQEYGCAEEAGTMALEGARLARQAADACRDRKIWVAGSMGPTSKTLSLSTDMTRPEARGIDFSTMAEAYYVQARSLIEGGADILLLETCFDALNAKAALYAIQRVGRDRGAEIPVMVSATINDRSGRTLTGQTLDAFFTSVCHYPILSFGINCSFGVGELRPFAERLAGMLPVCFSIHPNAGLPNEMGEYDESPEEMAAALKDMAAEGLLNIAGGCCGTTPAHIAAISEALRGMKPRRLPEADGCLRVSGLETVGIDMATTGFVNIGERTNVAGSRKFARLIAAKEYEEAANVARHQIEGGARIIDINMDDAMLDSRKEMETFVRYVSNDPTIARAAFMIDSSDWETILAGLQNAQGKCIVNSISLKNGEQDFLDKARELRRYGAAAVVMAFDEKGQATTFDRKVEICTRAYRLLTGTGFPPHDIVFDVNILSVGTGIAEHRAYATDFIAAVRWIKENLPGCRTSGGVSNLSFAFRGNNKVREAMHAAFLYHAIGAGLDMAIVNPAMLQVYDEIDKSLLVAVEDVILNRDEAATERLIALADELKAAATDGMPAQTRTEGWREGTARQRLTAALVKGNADFLQDDIAELLSEHGGNAVAVIEGPLMHGMEHVGSLFAEGKMFLPQVVKAAKVMKDAVGILQPMIEDAADASHEAGARPKIVMATVNGDVHDIGKNIVSIVLSCNNFEVIDLGVMVPNEKILEAVNRYHPLLVGVSGLITPSLKEMENLCVLFEKEGLRIPIFVGGATTSALHTAVRLAPLYSGAVVHGGDASFTAVLAKRFATDSLNAAYKIRTEQESLRERYALRNEKPLAAFSDACRQAPKFRKAEGYPALSELKPFENVTPEIAEVVPYIDWAMLLRFWGFHGESLEEMLARPEARETLAEAKAVLAQATSDGSINLRSLLRFEDARRAGNDIRLASGQSLPMLRSQGEGSGFLSLADFFEEDAPAPIGMLCIAAQPADNDGNDRKSYRSLMLHALCARLVEAAAEKIQHDVYGTLNVIRPAFGYPSCPDHSMKRLLVDMTDAEKRLGIVLNDKFAFQPSTTLCALFIAHPEARYFPVGKIDDEQLRDYSRRRNLPVQTIELSLR